jgi:phosphinothricin acetyltransferase
MTVRHATQDDYPAILELWNIAINDTLITFNVTPKTLPELTDMLDTRHAAGRATFVAEKDGRVVGFASYDQFRPGSGYAPTVEHSIMLAEGARGHGLGRALMNVLEDHARNAGHHSIIAGVSGANPDGIAFHAALGYARTAMLSQVGFKWDQWLDLHLMQKFLSPDTPGR